MQLMPAPLMQPMYQPNGVMSSAWQTWFQLLYANMNSGIAPGLNDVVSPLVWDAITLQLSLHGLSGLGSADQLVGVNSGATSLEYKSAINLIALTTRGNKAQITIYEDASGNLALDVNKI